MNKISVASTDRSGTDFHGFHGSFVSGETEGMSPGASFLGSPGHLTQAPYTQAPGLSFFPVPAGKRWK